MNKNLFSLIIIFTLLPFYSFCQINNDGIQTFASKKAFENASIAFCVKDMTGKTIRSLNIKESLTPASTLKLLTTATALEVLGENYKFQTTLSVDQNNPYQLIVHGYGDPTLGSEHIGINPNAFLDEWVSQIKNQFGREKPIDILIVDNYFGYKGVSSKWLQEDLGNYFAAAAYGISIYDNLYRLSFNTTNVNQAPKIIGIKPNMPDMEFLNTLSVNNTNQDNGYINGEIFSNKRTLVGDIPAKRTSFTIKGDIPDPGLMLGQILRDKLLESGFKVGKVETSRKVYYEQMYASLPSDGYKENVFYTHYSPPLKDIIRVINEKSNNHYTEYLIRSVGRSLGSKDIYADALSEGIDNVNTFWQQKGVNIRSIHIYDGCGLAPSNSISAETLCDILIYMNTGSKNKDAYFASLPKAGKEGTVKNVLKGSRLDGKIVMKSGSIANVQCFAGYYTDGNKRYAFSVMVNNYNSPRKQVVGAIENLLLDTLN